MQTQPQKKPLTSSAVVRPQMNLLQETVSVSLQLIEAKDSEGKCLVRGEFARVGIATENKRVYPSKLWEREIKRLEKGMQERKVLGELDHPADGRTQLTRVSHIVTGLSVDDSGLVIGEAEILDTDQGRNLKALLKSGARIGVSSRGYGSTKANPKGEEVVQDDYRLVTFDFVAEPADSTAYPDVFFEEKGHDMDLEKLTLEEVKEKNPGLYESIVKSREEELAAEWARRLDTTRQEERSEAAKDLRDEFSRELLAQIAKMKSEVREQIRGELLSDPGVAGARAALDKVKEVLRPYVLPEDVEAVLKTKDSEIGRIRNQIAERDLKIKDLESEVEKFAEVAKEAGYKYYLEQQISGDENADLIRKLVGDVKKFASSDEIKVKVEALRSDLAKKNEERKTQIEEDTATKQELEKTRALAERLALNNKELALNLYVEKKLTNHPQAGKIRPLIESANPRTKEEVNALFENFREPARDTEELEEVRSRVRKATKGGLTASELDEDASSIVSKRPSGNMNEVLGVPMSDLRVLAGIERRGK